MLVCLGRCGAWELRTLPRLKTHEHSVFVLKLIPAADRRRNEINTRGIEKKGCILSGTPAKADVDFPTIVLL